MTTLTTPDKLASDNIISEVLLETSCSWDNVPYISYPSGKPQFTVLKITIPPNTYLPWHSHSIPNAGYILSGFLTIENKNGGKKTLYAGDAVAETVDTLHRGYTGTSPATLIVFYAGSNATQTSNPSTTSGH